MITDVSLRVVYLILIGLLSWLALLGRATSSKGDEHLGVVTARAGLLQGRPRLTRLRDPTLALGNILASIGATLAAPRNPERGRAREGGPAGPAFRIRRVRCTPLRCVHLDNHIT
jgi:hypothetical protein